MRINRMPTAFKNFLISYIIILIIPNIAGYVSYRASIDVARASSIENSLMMLEQSEKILERRMDEVAGFTRQLAINKDLNLLMSESIQGEKYNVFGYWKTTREIADYSQTNDFLQNFYIYFNKHNVVLTPGSMYYRPEHYYELNHYEDLSYEEWQKTIVQATHEQHIFPMMSFMQGDKQKSVITYAQSLPLNSFGNPHATVVVLIDEKIISNLLESMTSQYGGWAFISDESNHTLSAQGIKETEISALQLSENEEANKSSRYENGMLLITQRSEKTGWVYRAGIPQEALMAKANTIKRMTWGLSAVAIVVGLIIGLLLAYRNSMPLHRLLTVLKEQIGMDTVHAKNEYEYLSGSISNLIINNKQLQSELNKQIPILRDTYLKRLITGEYNSPKEIEAVGSQAGIGLNREYGSVGIIQINGYANISSKEAIYDLSVARLIVKQMMTEIDIEHPMADLGSDKMVVLFTSETEPNELWRKYVERIIEQLSEKIYTAYDISFTIAMGGPYHTLSDINRSFDEARQSLEYSIYMGVKDTVWFQDTVRETSMYHYPIDMEQRLLNTIKAGEIEEGKRILAQVFHQNFNGRELSYEMTEQLIGEIKGTILKLFDLKGLHSTELFEDVRKKMASIVPKNGLEQVRNSLENIIEDFSGLVTGRKNDLHHETIQRIIVFMETEYTDPDITLYRIAQKAGLSEKYISQLFKEQKGINISDYLESIRINKASELLAEKNFSIDEVALQVGYNSAHTFRRAFKKVKGDSPSKYRLSSDR